VLRRADRIAFACVGLALAVGLAALPALPARFAVHFDAAGRPDTLFAAPVGVLVLPAVGAAAVVLSRLGRGGRSAVVADAAVALVGATVAYLQIVLVAVNLGAPFDPRLAVVPVLVAAGGLVLLGRRGGDSQR
jgi:hypothetical protein